MKSYIRNVLLLGALALPVCGAPKNVASKSGLSGVLVFQRSKKLEAINLMSGKTSVLRDSFLFDNAFKTWGNDWEISFDGRQVAFAALPRDVDFFSAASYRAYLWITPFDNDQRVLLAAYGKRATKEAYTFSCPSWSGNGKQMAVEREDRYAEEPSEVAVYDTTTRQELWNSRTDSAKLFPHDFGNTPASLNIYRDVFSPALSSDGNDLVCFSIGLQGGGFRIRVPDKAPPITVLHFNLKRHSGEILASLDDKLFLTSDQRRESECVWHPTQKRILFVGPASETGKSLGLFSLDLNAKTKKLARLTNGAQDDFSPQWSLDGKQIYWIRGSVNAQKSSNNRIFRANADGSNPAPILPQLRGVTRIQLLPKIADWSRYRKLSIEPLAGKDK